MTAQPGSDEEFTDRLRKVTCAAFDVKPWELGIAPVPWHVRLLAPFRWRWWWWRIRRTWFRLSQRKACED